MVQQLALNIQLKVNFRFDNFLGGTAANRELVARLENIETDTSDRSLYLQGPRGSGKTHLLQATAHHCADAGLHISYLPLRELKNHPPAMIENLHYLDLICVDDVDMVAGRADWEEALFSLYNLAHEYHCLLVFTARNGPEECGFGLADLSSRLAWGTRYNLVELDDNGKKELIALRATALGLDLEPKVIEYILRRAERSTSQIISFLEQLDSRSLAGQRRITLPFVRSELDHYQQPETR